jgi:hypothetical protein
MLQKAGGEMVKLRRKSRSASIATIRGVGDVRRSQGSFPWDRGPNEAEAIQSGATESLPIDPSQLPFEFEDCRYLRPIALPFLLRHLSSREWLPGVSFGLPTSRGAYAWRCKPRIAIRTKGEIAPSRSQLRKRQSPEQREAATGNSRATRRGNTLSQRQRATASPCWITHLDDPRNRRPGRLAA